MAVASTNELKRVLFDAYGGFADKRIKNIDKGYLFIIDDRTSGDKDATGNIFYWFCQVFAEVIDESTVKIRLSGSVPIDATVSNWLMRNEGEQTDLGVIFIVRRGHQNKLSELSAAWRSMVQSGRRYTEKSHKYVCPRTASTIEKFRNILDGAWTM